MNRFVLISLCCISLVTAAVHQYFLIHSISNDNRRLLSRLREAEAGKIELEAETLRIDRLIESERQRHSELENKLACIPAASSALLAKTNPSSTECWPAGKPWCLLAKTNLPHYVFSTIDTRGKISDEAAALFGMSSEERAAMDKAFARFKEELFDLDYSCLKKLAPEDSSFKTYPNMVSSVFSLAVPEEKTRAILGRYGEAVQSILKGNRSRYFLEAEHHYFDTWYHELNSSSLLLVFYTDPKSADRWSFQSSVTVENKRTGNGYCFYPTDETAEGFAHYAALCDQYLKTTD